MTHDEARARLKRSSAATVNDTEFRALLDWWMCSDPMPAGVPKEVIDKWLDGVAQLRGYDSLVAAYHQHGCAILSASR